MKGRLHCNGLIFDLDDVEGDAPIEMRNWDVCIRHILKPGWVLYPKVESKHGLRVTITEDMNFFYSHTDEEGIRHYYHTQYAPQTMRYRNKPLTRLEEKNSTKSNKRGRKPKGCRKMESPTRRIIVGK